MTQQRVNDELSLIDFLSGNCEASQASGIKERLEKDEDFRQLHDDIKNTLNAVGLAPEIEAPQDLVEKTLAKISSAKRTEALIAKQEIRRRVLRPTLSLRELTAVAAVILLAVIVFVPSIQQARQKQLAIQCASQAGRIGSAILSFANANNDQLPTAGVAEARWLANDSEPVVSNSAGLFKLVGAGFASPTLFQCPAVGGRSFVVQSGMADFPADEHISYSYQHSLGSEAVRRDDPEMAMVAQRMAILSDSTPLFKKGRFHPDKISAQAGDNHRAKGQNVLYLDMHVDWAESPNVGVGGNNIFLAEGIYKYKGTEKPTGPTDTFLLPAYSSSGR